MIIGFFTQIGEIRNNDQRVSNINYLIEME